MKDFTIIVFSAIVGMWILYFIWDKLMFNARLPALATIILLYAWLVIFILEKPWRQ